MCSPNVATDFANNHNFAVAGCLRRLLEVDDLPAQALATAHRPLSQGGVRLTCTSVLATLAFWSSWEESLPVIHNQLPCVPRTGFFLVELDAGLALGRVGQGVVDWAGSVGWHHEVDIVKTRWVGDVAALCGGRLVGRRKKIGQHEWVALLATLGLGNYVGFAGGTVPNVVGRGSIEHFDEG